jgi:hypothetical protein
MEIEREELWSILMRFNREVIAPDVHKIVNTAFGALQRDMYSHFDAIYKRFDNIDSELVAIKGGLKRLEARMDRRSALRHHRIAGAPGCDRTAACSDRSQPPLIGAGSKSWK